MALSARTRLVVVLLLMLAAFLGGFIPMFLQNQQLAEQVSEAQQQRDSAQMSLKLARLQNELGLVLVEVERNNFGRAGEMSTRFFDNVRAVNGETTDTGVQQMMADLLSQRDDITASLTSLNPETAMKLRNIYVTLAQSRGLSP